MPGKRIRAPQRAGIISWESRVVAVLFIRRDTVLFFVSAFSQTVPSVQ